MIMSSFGFGATPAERVPFKRPAGAGFFTPQLPTTAWRSHLNPFMSVLDRMTSVSANIGPRPVGLEPAGIGPRAGGPLVAPMPQPVPLAYNSQGFGASAMSPYRALRTGMFPGIQSSGANVRAGVTSAGQVIRRLSPAGYPNVNVPAGGY